MRWIPFDFSLMYQTYQSLRNDPSVSRVPAFVFVLMTIGCFFLNCIHSVFFLIDSVLFSSHTKIKIKTPTFIIGCPRSGTSFLHRTIASSEQYTGMKLWEMRLCPSITQRKIVLFFARIDKKIGSPLNRFFDCLEALLWPKEYNEIHESGRNYYEEDVNLFKITGSCVFWYLIFPFEHWKRLMFHLEVFEESYQKKHFDFYRACIQKHLYVHGEDKIYLSKNPSYSTWAHLLADHFDGAKFIYLVRTPYEVAPSALRLVTYVTDKTLKMDRDEVVQIVLDMLLKAYHRPFEESLFNAPHQAVVLPYVELVAHPQQSIIGALEELSLPINQQLNHTLKVKEEQAKGFSSKNVYSYEEYGLTKEYIGEYFDSVFERFTYLEK